METVDIHEAERHLSKLFEQVVHGETIVIAKSGGKVGCVMSGRWSAIVAMAILLASLGCRRPAERYIKVTIAWPTHPPTAIDESIAGPLGIKLNRQVGDRR